MTTADVYPAAVATPVQAGRVAAIRAARSWPVFAHTRSSKVWINLLMTVVAIAASYGAAIGQAGFAELYLGMHGPERFVVFLIIEATAVALMLLANQTALAGDSAGGLWTLVWAVTAGAVTMQVIHANAIGQPEAAMVYATASVLTVVLWRAKTRRSLRDRLRQAGMIEDPLPRYRPVRWVLRPRETFRAWYLALGEGISDPTTALDMARADRLYHRAATAARAEARRARKANRPVPDHTSETHLVPPWRVTDPDAYRFGVLPWHSHPTAIGTDTEPVADVDGARMVDADKPQPTPRKAASRRKPTGSPDATTRVLTAIEKNPDATQAEIARLAKTTDRTVRRVMSARRVPSRPLRDRLRAGRTLMAVRLVRWPPPWRPGMESTPVANETTLTIVGNLTADPELRFTPNGAALAKFTVAATPRRLDKATGQWTDGDPLFMYCSAWRDLAENVAESLSKGSRVVVTGRLRLAKWQTPDGEQRSAMQLDVEDVGASLRYATAKVTKMSRTSTNAGNGAPPTDADPWASTSGQESEPPF